MSTSYHISYSSLLLKAPAGPEKSLSVLVLWGNIVQDMYFKIRILKKIHLYHYSCNIGICCVHIQPNFAEVKKSYLNKLILSFCCVMSLVVNE